jgi:tRNA pseudouridine32 synthase/23S rRNA pseudouridine746 synthase/23S rRNA pseudouridine1911/1915/1917 synthase
MGFMKFIAEEDISLLDVLALMAPESSKTTLRSWIKEGRVLAGDSPELTANTLIRKGQEVTVGAKPNFVTGKLRLVYEDSHLVVVDKPEGLLSVATAFEKGDTVHAFLRRKYRPRKVYIVHRLDQDTSGIMMFALSEKAYVKLKRMFEVHDLERRYCAIVEGQVEPLQGTWQSYLYEDANYVVHSTENPEEGRLSTTHYKVQGTAPYYTRLELILETGRKNQIRVHCSDAEHPVVGDKKYGSSKKSNKRLCLHAYLLAFKHPITGKPLCFESPVPPLFDRLVMPIDGGDKKGKKHA